MHKRKIFYFAFDHDKPSGGIKEAYRHVDILNSNGFDAFILHQRDGARASWFDHETPIVSAERFSAVFDDSRDFVVLPEDLSGGIDRFPGRKVIFNQNVFHGFAALGRPESGQSPYLHPDVKAVFSVSDHNAEYLRYAYPHADVYRLFIGIDLDRFSYRPVAEKSLKVVCYVRKNPAHTLALYHLLKSRADQDLDNLGRLEWTILDGQQTENQVIREFGDALLFVFLSIEEGCPLMPLEAAASGAVPLVYDGGPAMEWLPEPCRFAYGDLLGMAGAIAELAAGFPGAAQRWSVASREARDKAAFYSLGRQQRRLLEAWEEVLRKWG
ncbi:MAG: hypothetical protein ACE5G3_10130 [Gammaproteobacteria bacterium]